MVELPRLGTQRLVNASEFDGDDRALALVLSGVGEAGIARAVDALRDGVGDGLDDRTSAAQLQMIAVRILAAALGSEATEPPPESS